MNYSDVQIKATFAHKHTDLILIVTVGNFIVTAIFIIYRIIVYIAGSLIAFANNNFSNIIVSLLIDVVLVAMMWIWTKIGTVLVMHSSR